VYKTKNGRTVYGGGGIIPDSVIVEKNWPYVIQALFGKDVFFKFANHCYPKLKEKKVKIDKDFKVTDALRKEFFAFLDSTGFKFQSIAQVRYGEFKTRAGLVDSVADSVPKVGPIDESLQGPELEGLKKASREVEAILAKASARTLLAHNTEVDRYLTEALLIRELGQDHDLVQRTILANDTQLKLAISILQKKAEYERFLTPSKK
jgi:carboxyl-terminal processing protease